MRLCVLVARKAVRNRKCRKCLHNLSHMSLRACLNGVDRPARLPLCAHCVDKSPYSFALTSISLSDLISFSIRDQGRFLVYLS